MERHDMTHFVFENVHAPPQRRCGKELVNLGFQCFERLTLLLVPMENFDIFDVARAAALAQRHNTPAVTVFFEVRQQSAGVLAT